MRKACNDLLFQPLIEYVCKKNEFLRREGVLRTFGAGLFDLQLEPVAHDGRLVVRPVALQVAEEGRVEASGAQPVAGHFAAVQLGRLVGFARLARLQHSRLLAQHLQRDALSGHRVDAAQRRVRADRPHVEPANGRHTPKTSTSRSHRVSKSFLWKSFRRL